MDQQGEKVHNISRWMGHSTIKIAVNTYMRAGLFRESDDGLRSRQDTVFLGTTIAARTVVPLPARLAVVEQSSREVDVLRLRSAGATAGG